MPGDWTMAPIENSSRSGGKSRVLGDWPRSTTRPLGSRARRSRSAVMSTTNLSRSTARRVVVPFRTWPNLTSVSICGRVAQAINVPAGGRPWSEAMGMTRERPSAVTATVNGPAGPASSMRPETPVIPGAGTSSMQYRSWLGPSGVGGSQGRCCAAAGAAVKAMKKRTRRATTALAALDLERQARIHQRRAAVHGDRLACDPAGFFRAEQRHSIPDIGRGAEPAHRGPAPLMPGANHVLGGVRERVEHAVLDPPGTDGVHGDASLGERHGEVTAQRLHGDLRRPHPDPWLPAAGTAARRVRDSDDPATVTHQGTHLADRQEERLGLGIHGRVPLPDGDVHRSLIELRHVRPGVADEDVERAELLLRASEHARDVFGPADIGLDRETIRATLPHLGEGVFGGCFVLAVVDRDFDAPLRQLERDAAADAARASGDQGVLPVVRHG